MKYIYCSIIYLANLFCVYSQSFYFNDQFGVGLFNIKNCDTTYLIGNYTSWNLYSEMYVKPNKDIYFLERNGVKLLNLLMGGKTTKVIGAPVNPYITICNNGNGGDEYVGFTSDFRGYLYFSDWCLKKWDPNTQLATELGPFDKRVDALISVDNRLFGLEAPYANSSQRNFIEINLKDTRNNRVLFNVDSLYWNRLKLSNDARDISFSLSTNSTNCDSFQIILTLGKTKYLDTNNFTYVYEVDTLSKSLKQLCYIGNPCGMVGVGFEDAYKTTRCVLAIDLDDDDSNSSGQSYRDTLICPTDTALVHDNDWYFHSRALIDSIIISLDQGVVDGINESVFTTSSNLFITEMRPQFNKISLYNLGLAQESDFKAIIGGLRYFNNSVIPTSGTRRILITAYSSLSVDSAYAYVYIEPYQLAGRDTIIEICKTDPTFQLYDQLGFPKKSGGNWMNNKDKFIPGIDTAATFYYTVQRKNCGIDTAQVKVVYKPEPIVNLGPDTLLCLGQELVLRIESKGGLVFWQDFSSEDSFLVNQDGKYYVSLEAINGCLANDTINVQFLKTLPVLDTMISICEGTNFIFNNKSYTKGNYIDTIQSRSSCDTIVRLNITNSLNIKLTKQISICQNKSYLYKGKNYNIGDQFFDTLRSPNACDTIVTFKVIGQVNTQSNQSVTICEGKLFNYKGIFYSAGDIILDTLSGNGSSCDTLVKITINEEKLRTVLKDTLICKNDTLNYHSKNYKVGDTILLRQLGFQNTCDTLVTLSVKSLPINSLTLIADTLICKGKQTSINSSPASSYLWSTGEKTSSINVNAGTYTLTITDNNNCTNTKSITINEAPEIQFTLEVLNPICSDDEGNIHIINTPGATEPIKYFLNGAQSMDGIYNNLLPGKYNVKIVDALGCEKRDTINIIAAKPFDISLAKDIISLDESTSELIFYSVLQGKLKLLSFSPDENISIENNSIRVKGIKNTIYTLTFEDENGCIIIKTLEVRINSNTQFYVPNAFSPNGDNINDTWEVVIGSSYKIQSLSIFDRWGDRVYSSSTKFSWDGTFNSRPLNPGVYTYSIVVLDSSNMNKFFTGDITLLK